MNGELACNTCAILGFGGRGGKYASLLSERGVRIVAVCDVDPKKLEIAGRLYGIPESSRYFDYRAMLKSEKADLLVIATLDREHPGQALAALDAGFDLLLEKPVAGTVEDCLRIAEKARQTRRHVFVCHELRYTPFYTAIKSYIEQGMLGEIVNISQTENIGYLHYAHSFVRGNWRDSDRTTPMILQKCCHDFDIFNWLLGKQCKSVYSMGGLYQFRAERAPQGCAAYCRDCGIREDCIYDALKIYSEHEEWLRHSAQYYGDYADKEAIRACFSQPSNPFARCVYRCDNNVPDHQVVTVEYEGGVLAQLVMTAFSDEICRNVRIHGTLGCIEGKMEDGRFLYCRYGGKPVIVDANPVDSRKQHAGGDERLIDDIYCFLRDPGSMLGKTQIYEALDSHRIGFAAEQSRLEGGRKIVLDGSQGRL